VVRYTIKRKKEMENNALFLVIMSNITIELENLGSTAVRYTVRYTKKEKKGVRQAKVVTMRVDKTLKYIWFPKMLNLLMPC
jgi:hypothetical protein